MIRNSSPKISHSLLSSVDRRRAVDYVNSSKPQKCNLKSHLAYSGGGGGAAWAERKANDWKIVVLMLGWITDVLIVLRKMLLRERWNFFITFPSSRVCCSLGRVRDCFLSLNETKHSPRFLLILASPSLQCGRMTEPFELDLHYFVRLELSSGGWTF